MYHGDIRLGDTIDIKFTTRRFTTGAPFALASGVISAYPDNSTTQLTAGITLTADFDTVTGLNNCRVVATSGNGYATATNYTLVITTGTVDSVSVVGECIGSFSIEARSALRPTVAARTLDVSATGEAGVDWANVGSPTTTLALTGTTIASTQKVDIETIKTNPVVNAGTVTFPTTATLASTTNITAGTITTATTTTNLTNERGKYTHGAVWIGSVANTNTVNYTDGILTNPVSTIAAAKTIADSLGLKRFWVQSGVTISLLADMDNYVFDGFNYNFNTSGGTRSISGTVIRNCFVGTAISVFSGANPPYFDNCEFGTATVTLPAANLNHCEFNTGVVTLGTGNTDLIDCCSVVAGSSTPSFTIPAGTVNVSFRRWSGGITIGGITSGTTVSIDVVSGGTVTLNGADGTVNVRGMVNAITDNRTGTPTLNRGAALNQTFLATPTNITAGTITTTTNLTNLPAITANWLTAAGTAADFGAEIADAVHDEQVDGTTTFRESIRLHNAALAGKASGLATTTAVYRDLADTKDRISATVDADGNRTAVTRDVT